MIVGIARMVVGIVVVAIVLGLALFAFAQWLQYVDDVFAEPSEPRVPAEVDLEQCVTTTRAIADDARADR